jgi:N-acetylglucosaminyldiphosphoundecaprenol N-acetyl-beta-D-mannosaminyltransferase
MINIPSLDFYGLKLSVFSINSLADYIKNCIQGNHKIICYGYSLGIIAMMKKYPQIFHYGRQADIIVTDGRPFYLLLKVLGIRIGEDLSIPNMVNLVLDLCEKNGFSIMLIGASCKTNIQAAKNIKLRYKNIKIYPGHHGYFDYTNEYKVADLINKYSPDVVFIGISSPRKEILACKWKAECNTKIIIPCGGMIDVLAGITKQTPHLVKKIGLASVYRVIQEPKRLLKRNLEIYIFCLFKFLPALIKSTLLSKNKNFNIPAFLQNL